MGGGFHETRDSGLQSASLHADTFFDTVMSALSSPIALRPQVQTTRGVEEFSEHAPPGRCGDIRRATGVAAVIILR